jgi:hypothetical protein
MEALDARFHLTRSGNYEILVAWLEIAARSGWAKALPRTGEVLGKVGRMKYLKPLYRALASRAETRAQARAWFEQFRAGYHPIAVQVLDPMLQKAGA